VRQQFHQRGTLEPRTYRSGRRTLLTEERKQRLEKLLSEQPDATLTELGATRFSGGFPIGSRSLFMLL
jgi:transposase